MSGNPTFDYPTLRPIAGGNRCLAADLNAI